MTTNILPVPASQTRLNFRHLYADVIWFGVLSGSTIAFLSVFAARLGGNGFQIGLLSAGPAVVNLLLSLHAGRWLENKSLSPAAFWSAALHRLGYLFFIPLPWLFNESEQVWGLVWVTLLMSLPGTLLSISFNALFAEAVPPYWRAHVVGRRNALIAVSVTLTSLICGQILVSIPFPLNYQIVFLLGAVGGALSTYHLGQLRLGSTPAPQVGKALFDLAGPGVMRFVDRLRHPGLRFLIRSQGKSLLRFDLLRSPFGPFLLSSLLFYTFQTMPVPLFPLYYVGELNLSEATISLGSALFHAMMMVGSLQISKLSARFGHRSLMVSGAILFGGYPLLMYLARGASLFWVASILGGFVWAVLNAGLVNRLMERVPEDDRPAHMALNNLALNLGVLAGAFLGPLVGDILGIRDALLISAVLRLVGGLLFLRWG